jgi:hypothetical protein
MPTFNSGRRKALRAAVALAACASTGSRAANVLAAATTSGDNVFALGNFALEAGTILPDARIAFKTHGRLNADGGNATLYPTQFAAQHGDIEWMIGPGRALDPVRYFVIVVDRSSSAGRWAPSRPINGLLASRTSSTGSRRSAVLREWKPNERRKRRKKRKSGN